MNAYRVDLNLLGVFQAIFETNSVTLAAERYRITQPAMSNALARLREVFGDPLFVHTASGMQPTPYAIEIAGSVRNALHNVQTALGHRQTFDPASSDRTFRFYMTDMGQMYFLPLLLERLQKIGRNVRVEVETVSHEEIRRALEEGSIDFALGKLPKVSGRGIRSQLLFNEHYDVLTRTGHPASKGGLTRKAFLAAAHAVVASVGGGHQIIEDTLVKMQARIIVRVPNFMVISMMLSRTDIIVIVPSRLAKELTKTGEFEAFALPVTIPEWDVNVFWHERFENDAAVRWMLGQLAELFHESLEGEKRV